MAKSLSELQAEFSDEIKEEIKEEISEETPKPALKEEKSRAMSSEDMFWLSDFDDIKPKVNAQKREPLIERPAAYELTRKPRETVKEPKKIQEPIKEKNPAHKSEKIEPEKANKKTKKRGSLKIASDIMFYSAIAIMLIWAISFSLNGTTDKSFFGYRYFNVLSDSMKSVYPRGSLVFVKVADIGSLGVGDDITFTVDQNTTITHRIVAVDDDYNSSGVRAFQTQGVNNPSPDEDWVMGANVLGKVTAHVPMLGFVLNLLAKNVWIIIVLFILVIILSFTMKILLADRKKVESGQVGKKKKKQQKQRVNQIRISNSV